MLHGVPKNEPRRAQDDPKRGQRRPRTTLRCIQEAPKSDPESQDEKKSEPRRSRDRLGPPMAPKLSLLGTPRGSIWEAKMAPESIPKRSKIEAKIQDEKKATQDDLGPILERSWVDLGPILGLWNRSKHYACRCFVNIHFFDVKTVRRRLWDDFRTNFGRPRRQHDRK